MGKAAAQCFWRLRGICSGSEVEPETIERGSEVEVMTSNLVREFGFVGMGRLVPPEVSRLSAGEGDCRLETCVLSQLGTYVLARCELEMFAPNLVAEQSLKGVALVLLAANHYYWQGPAALDALEDNCPLRQRGASQVLNAFPKHRTRMIGG